MVRTLKSRRFVWLGVGLMAGLMLSGFWPQTPLHAVATDRSETFAIATGYVDEGLEAVYFLDFLTGDLSAVVLGRQGRAFTGFFRYNVVADLGVDLAKHPKFMLITGAADMRRGMGGSQYGTSVVYVAEVTTGKVAAYAVPWSTSAYASGRILGPAPLIPLAATPFRVVPAIAPPVP